MQAYTEPVSSTTGSLVGCEPMPLTTYSLNVDAAQGILSAGTFINNAGIKAVTAADMLGILAHDVDTGAVGATEQRGVTIFTSGSFLEARIKAANPAVTLDAAGIATLRAKNIYIERSVPITEAPATFEAREGEEQERERETEDEGRERRERRK